MFARSMRQAKSKETQLDDWLIDRFEFVIQPPGTLIIRPKVSRLDRVGLQQVCQRLLETEGLRLSRIQFDFSMVTEFSGSWSIHFGLLIRLSREVTPRVSVTELRGLVHSHDSPLAGCHLNRTEYTTAPRGTELPGRYAARMR